ncbi:MAG TPA: ClpXP protease specificity-enhancing factor [Gammaproteobacteria bacterium]|nr:ClpXP protease specificity-enhancing factor [Gammaproteobacteria bacterium]
MTSSRPYLIRALYEWITDNGLTPYILVDAGVEAVVVPRQFVRDGQIVLNISPSAVQALELTNEHVAFNARFSGQAMAVHVPAAAVLAIYARENGEGMMFRGEGDAGPPEPPGDQPPKSGRPRLKVVQ